GPPHFSLFIYSGQPVNELFNRPQQRIEKCLFPVEHSRHENPERFRHEENHEQIQCNLKPSICRHGARTPPLSAVRRAGSRTGGHKSQAGLHRRRSWHSPYFNRSQPRTYKIPSRKNAAVAIVKITSSMVTPLAECFS